MGLAPALRRDHLTVQVVDGTGRRPDLVYATNEFERAIAFAFSWTRILFFVVLTVATGGFLLVVCAWFPQVFTYVARQRLPAACQADANYLLILVHGDPDSLTAVWTEVKVHRIESMASKTADSDDKTKQKSKFFGKKSRAGSLRQARPFVYFEFKKSRYSFNYVKGEFERYRSVLTRKAALYVEELESKEVADKKTLMGDNICDVPSPNYFMLVFAKISHPYYLFQVFSAIVWFLQEYTVYAIVILVLSFISLSWEVGSEISNNRRLRNLMHSNRKVKVFRVASDTDAAVSPDGKRQITCTEVLESELVPGDIFQVESGNMIADAMLVRGSCIADESSLTGEARPIMKEQAKISGEPGMMTEDEAKSKFPSSILHSGSIMLSVEENTRAVVLSTGFSTGKGELFRTILFPKHITFEFERDSYRYLAVLGAIAIGAFIKRIVDNAKLEDNFNFGDTLINSLDLITIAVPPALPLVLSSGISFALQRLRNRGIFCIDSQRINLCGQLSCFCFDKTGTLTKDDLTFVGVSLINSTSDNTSSFSNILHDIPDKLREGMASCNELRGGPEVHKVKPADSKPSFLQRLMRSKSAEKSEPSVVIRQGSALDTALIAASGAELNQIDGTTIVRLANKRVGTVHESDISVEVDGVTASAREKVFKVIQRHAFNASLQLSSVVVAPDSATTDRVVWVKGSTEAICKRCAHDTKKIQDQTKIFSAMGYYCIAFAAKSITRDINVENRETIEAELEFQGLALFKNEIKPESSQMLKELYEADIDIRVITGDNTLTAIHVCRELDVTMKPQIAVVDIEEKTGDVSCQPVQFEIGGAITFGDEDDITRFDGSNMSRVIMEYEIALTGAAIEKLRTECSDDSMKYLLGKTLIFARIKPQQKAWIVEQLMELGKIVGMCGDGTNDCGALKTAHVGLALSSAEASIVAPFTSKAKAITDVPALIREGRCALATSFLAFKFMVLYPIIQLAMASTLAHYNLMLTNNQYLWDDMAIVLGLAILMLYTKSSETLSSVQPPKTLFAMVISGSIIGQVVIFLGFFAAQIAMLHYQHDWFCPIADAYAYLAGDSTISSNCAAYLNYNTPENPYSFEDTCIWLFSHLQYISVAAAFNIKDDFRHPLRFFRCPNRLGSPFSTNWPHALLLLATLGVNLWFLLDTSGTIDDTFQTMPIPFDYRWKMLVLFIGHFIASMIWEVIATRVLPKCFMGQKEEGREDAQKLLKRPSVYQRPSSQSPRRGTSYFK